MAIIVGVNSSEHKCQHFRSVKQTKNNTAWQPFYKSNYDIIPWLFFPNTIFISDIPTLLLSTVP
jgi:hypothetical protein